MINRDFFIFFKGNAIKTGCQSENATDNLRQFKIRSQHLGIDIVFLQLQFVGIETEIPRLQFEILAL